MKSLWRPQSRKEKDTMIQILQNEFAAIDETRRKNQVDGTPWVLNIMPQAGASGQRYKEWKLVVQGGAWSAVK